MLLIIFSIAVLSVSASTENNVIIYNEEDATEHFRGFINSFNKLYPHEEEKTKRFEIFKKNLKEINRLNSFNNAVFGITQFTDVTAKEIERQYMGFKQDNETNSCLIVTDDDVKLTDIPEALDYRQNAVTEVKDQMACGSCWIFSTIGAIEGSYAIKYKKLLSFSEQQLLDCLKCSEGCELGGSMIAALSELTNSSRIVLESNYPYEGNKKTCRLKSKVSVKVTGCYNYELKDERKMQEVLVKNGPISIGLNGYGLQHYQNGVFTKPSCSEDVLNHAVLLVGYGTDNGTDYWLIKNSWGKTFGEDGYARLSRGENTCGFMNEDAVSAILA